MSFQDYRSLHLGLLWFSFLFIYLFLSFLLCEFLVPPMVTSALASPLCTWLVAACASGAFEKDDLMRSSTFQSPKRLSQWPRRKKLVSKFISRGGTDFATNLRSYGSGNHYLMSSSLAFEPCNECNNSEGLYSRMTFFGDTGFLLFGSKTAVSRRQRCIHRAANSGNSLCITLILD